MSLSVDPSLRALDDCGCCAGTSAETPAAVVNRPGLSAIAYRVGTHAAFKESLLAGLSRGDRPALAGLQTRADDDFSIALLDAWATVADVLTFYQERIANESYLRTATERRSVLELARAIGYELNPGVAASAYLAFTLEEAPGAPGTAVIGAGTKVQSLPGPGERPQTFETVAGIEARREWNAIGARPTVPQAIRRGLTRLYLKGVATGLQAGDALLLVGDARERFPGSERWDVRLLQSVVPDAAADRTLVTWEIGLGSESPTVDPADNPRVFAFRQRAALFGHNAPDWRAMPQSIKDEFDPDGNQRTQWPRFEIRTVAERVIDLDAVYPKIVAGSWVALMKPTYVELYRAVTVSSDSRTDFLLTAKTTRVTLDVNEHLSWFGLRETVVLAQSEELELVETPLTDPVAGRAIVLDRPLEGVLAGATLIARGKPARARLAPGAGTLRLVGAGGAVRDLRPGEPLYLTAPVEDLPGGTQRWRLRTRDGFRGSVVAPVGDIERSAPDDEDSMLGELVEVAAVEAEDIDHARLRLASPLVHVYDRASFRLLANVAPATHGETVADEALGSGDAGQAYQRFALKQAPLTYTSADTPSGGQSTLTVRVNDLRWDEVPTLYGRGPRERVYVTRTDDDGKTVVQFGDGQTGARPPTGRENVRAAYRKGIGREGNVRADQLSLLLTRPLGVKGVVNPLPAAGGQDPQAIEDARDNAPLSVLTLDRIVSLRDYEDFARSFAGIAKARATWTWNGDARGVFLTVAGPDGADIPENGPTQQNLRSALARSGDARVPVIVRSFRAAPFRLAATVKYDPAYLPENVRPAVETALRARFSFAARAFGQPVAQSEVIAAIQNVPGVVSVDLDQLRFADEEAGLRAFLPAAAPRPGEDAAKAQPAQLLTLDLRPGDITMVAETVS